MAFALQYAEVRAFRVALFAILDPMQHMLLNPVMLLLVRERA